MNGKMSTSTIKNVSDALGIPMMSEKVAQDLRREAKKKMWTFYSMNRSNFHESIRECREEIIIELMKGEEVEKVFEVFGGVSLRKAG